MSKALLKLHQTSCKSALHTGARKHFSVECGFKFVNKDTKKSNGFGTPQVVKLVSQPGQQHSKKFQKLVDAVESGSWDEPKKPEVKLESHTSEEKWRELDQKLNKYPMQRTFTAIGEGGAELQTAIVAAVEGVLGEGRVSQGLVTSRPSSGDKYLSVKIGPVMVETPDQVIAIFASMKADPRVKWTV